VKQLSWPVARVAGVDVAVLVSVEVMVVRDVAVLDPVVVLVEAAVQLSVVVAVEPAVDDADELAVDVRVVLGVVMMQFWNVPATNCAIPSFKVSAVVLQFVLSLK
jgi:hypothetical protein